MPRHLMTICLDQMLIYRYIVLSNATLMFCYTNGVEYVNFLGKMVGKQKRAKLTKYLNRQFEVQLKSFAVASYCMS
jgi:hypothetical protein